MSGIKRHKLVSDPPTFYDILGIPPGSTAKDIQAAYHAHARRLHPDNPTHKDALGEFSVMTNVYAVLKKSKERDNYDNTLRLTGRLNCPDCDGKGTRRMFKMKGMVNKSCEKCKGKGRICV